MSHCFYVLNPTVGLLGQHVDHPQEHRVTQKEHFTPQNTEKKTLFDTIGRREPTIRGVFLLLSNNLLHSSPRLSQSLLSSPQ